MGLKVEHVNKTYGTKKVVNNISFEIDKPSVYGLLGTNGAGKTTTIRMILGILKKIVEKYLGMARKLKEKMLILAIYQRREEYILKQRYMTK